MEAAVARMAEFDPAAIVLSLGCDGMLSETRAVLGEGR